MMDKAEICRRIPHAGAMCLLDRVDSWNAHTIVCSATSHRHGDNPLRSRGRLHAICGVEYAAQAMAVHGSLRHITSPDKPSVGFLATVRDLQLFVDRLDSIKEALIIEAQEQNNLQGIFVYRFVITAAATALLTGRVAIKLMLDGDK